MKILHLTLTKAAFDVMVTGEKEVEIRKPSHWIYARLWENTVKGKLKHYDAVKFTNGYGNNQPFFVVEFAGVRIMQNGHAVTFGNEIKPNLNFKVNVEPGDVLINLGKIIQRGNLTRVQRKRVKTFEHYKKYNQMTGKQDPIKN